MGQFIISEICISHTVFLIQIFDNTHYLKYTWFKLDFAAYIIYVQERLWPQNVLNIRIFDTLTPSYLPLHSSNKFYVIKNLNETLCNTLLQLLFPFSKYM